jgi:hypothetical protein
MYYKGPKPSSGMIEAGVDNERVGGLAFHDVPRKRHGFELLCKPRRRKQQKRTHP